jgi:hypothetical protein
MITTIKNVKIYTCVGDDPFINISEATENVPTVDDTLYTIEDHDEGILIDPLICVIEKQKIKNIQKSKDQIGIGKD